jgi:hypothetical protein
MISDDAMTKQLSQFATRTKGLTLRRPRIGHLSFGFNACRLPLAVPKIAAKLIRR